MYYRGSTYPSSKARNSLEDPESLDMNEIFPIGMRVCNSFCAVMMGPQAFTCRCLEKASNELGNISISR